jgi:hypothetical protein
MGQHERLGAESPVSEMETGVVRMILDAFCLVTERKRMLGNIMFIGVLFEEQILNEKIVHECVKRLLLNEGEDSIECLCMLMATTGKSLDRSQVHQAKRYMDYYFNQMKQLAEKVKRKPGWDRLALMLRETIDLRRNMWQVAPPQVRNAVTALVESAAPDEEIVAWIRRFGPSRNVHGVDRNMARCIMGVVVRHACKEASGASALAAAHPGAELRRFRALLEKRRVLLRKLELSWQDLSFALFEVQEVSEEMHHPPARVENFVDEVTPRWLNNPAALLFLNLPHPRPTGLRSLEKGTNSRPQTVRPVLQLAQRTRRPVKGGSGARVLLENAGHCAGGASCRPAIGSTKEPFASRNHDQPKCQAVQCRFMCP